MISGVGRSKLGSMIHGVELCSTAIGSVAFTGELDGRPINAEPGTGLCLWVTGAR